MRNSQLRLVDDGPGPDDPVADELPENPDLTPKMMATSALMTIAFFMVYGAIRFGGLDAPRSLLAMTWINGCIAGLIYGIALVRKGSYRWLMAMVASAATMTGACFAVCHSTQNFSYLLIGGCVLLVAFLTALFRNIDERISFMPLVISLVVASSLILFALGV